MKKIDLTVLMPVYNTKPAHLIESISSIVNQRNVTPFKILIIDDGSTNAETCKAISSLDRMYDLRPFSSLLRTLESNKGTSHALNEGHKIVDTEYVAIMGSDDISDPNRLSKQIAFLQARPDIDVLGTQLFSFKSDDIHRKPLFTSKHPMYPSSIGSGWIVNHGTVIYKQEAVMAAGGYDETKRRGQDIDLWQRMFSAGNRFANLQESLYAWRRHV